MKGVILVDGGYFDKINLYLKEKKGRKLSLEKLSEKIVGNDTHLRTKLYNAYLYQSDKPTERKRQVYRCPEFLLYN